MIQIESNSEQFVVSTRQFKSAVREAISFGLAATAQEAYNSLKSSEFLGGISAQIMQRQSPGVGIPKPESTTQRSGSYKNTLAFAKENPMRYTISTDAIQAPILEQGGTIRAKKAKYLKFQVPTGRVIYTSKRGATLKKPRVDIDGWSWVQVESVNIPARPAWHDVANRSESRMITNITRFINERLHIAQANSQGMTLIRP